MAVVSPNKDPSVFANRYVESVHHEIQTHGLKIRVLGLIATDDEPSMTYARATQRRFDDAGIHYELRQVERLDLERVIEQANADDAVHGIFIYFPVFNNQQDDYLRNHVDYRKDIEAGSIYWTGKLYANDRRALDDNASGKALLPCTSLAIVKILTEIGRYAEDVARPIANKTVTIFNRSEVIGRPLAIMMSNDGAKVYSFDVNGPLLFQNAVPSETDISRAAALAQSDIVVTGVPHQTFDKIRPDEIRRGTICINFSSVNNFANGIADHTNFYIPRIGPMTVAMCMRNTLRLFHNFHGD